MSAKLVFRGDGSEDRTWTASTDIKDLGAVLECIKSVQGQCNQYLTDLMKDTGLKMEEVDIVKEEDSDDDVLLEQETKKQRKK